MTPLWLSLAGGVGALSRFVVDGHIRTKHYGAFRFPWGTTFINASGALILGTLTGLVLYHHASTDMKLILGTGFCGGYTTFSTASFEAVRLFEEKRVNAASWHIASNMLLTLGFAGVGMYLTRVIG
jgi:CrcB protein